MKRIITIGREFGSGGREFGRRIAEKLQIAYFDQEIITEIAKRTAMSEEYVRQIEEMRPTMSFPIQIGHSFYIRNAGSRNTITSNIAYFKYRNGFSFFVESFFVGILCSNS